MLLVEKLGAFFVLLNLMLNPLRKLKVMEKVMEIMIEKVKYIKIIRLKI